MGEEPEEPEDPLTAGREGRREEEGEDSAPETGGRRSEGGLGTEDGGLVENDVVDPVDPVDPVEGRGEELAPAPIVEQFYVGGRVGSVQRAQ